MFKIIKKIKKKTNKYKKKIANKSLKLNLNIRRARQYELMNGWKEQIMNDENVKKRKIIKYEPLTYIYINISFSFFIFHESLDQ